MNGLLTNTLKNLLAFFIKIKLIKELGSETAPLRKSVFLSPCTHQNTFFPAHELVDQTNNVHHELSLDPRTISHFQSNLNPVRIMARHPHGAQVH